MGQKRKSGKRHLSDEERNLWTRVTDSVTPINQAATNLVSKADLSEFLQAQGEPASGKNPKKLPTKPGATNKNAPTAPSYSPNGTSAAPQQRPTEQNHIDNLSLTGLDRRTEQKMKRGRIEVDATLDLHGMTQINAHTALRAFLVTAQARGHKLVLVITGKGNPEGPRYEADSIWGSGRGVLRRLVPDWLAQSDLRPYVSGFRNAHQRHGGGGALYIRIRRRR